MGKPKQEFPPLCNSKRSCSKRICWSDATLTVYQRKQKKNVCILSTMHIGVGTFSWAKAKPESVIYYSNTKSDEDIADWMARAYSVKGSMRSWPVAVLYNTLDLAGINARILFKEHQQQESPEESPAAAGRGVESRIHGGESGRGMDTDTEAVPVQKSCKRTLEMPQVSVW